MIGASHFDPTRAYVVPPNEYETDTGASLKDIMAALDGSTPISDDIYDNVERLLYKYQIFVLQGIRETIAKHKGVSWYLVDKCDGRALISYQDGPNGEWCHECFADEAPLWLIKSLLRRIARRKPLGDEDADDTIADVDRLGTAYTDAKDKRATERGGLVVVVNYPSYLRRRINDDDE